MLGHRLTTTTDESYFGAHGRAQMIEDRRDMARILEKDTLGEDDYRTTTLQIAVDLDNLRRFGMALADLQATADSSRAPP